MDCFFPQFAAFLFFKWLVALLPKEAVQMGILARPSIQV